MGWAYLRVRGLLINFIASRMNGKKLVSRHWRMLHILRCGYTGSRAFFSRLILKDIKGLEHVSVMMAYICM